MTRTFFLGTHIPNWLEFASVPLFISRRRLTSKRKNGADRVVRKTLPRARVPWALDSGAFSEIKLHGEWTVSSKDYANEVRRFRDEIGKMAWAAPQDWMCEPFMIERTGMSVEDHQALTTWSILDLRSRAPDVPWIPVLQGWEPDDYLRHLELYDEQGMDLTSEPVVGLGSVCRRQGTSEIGTIARMLSGLGISLHGFGLKTKGLALTPDAFLSADSLSWSFTARRLQAPGLPMCVGSAHKNCANCLPYALHWREAMLSHLPAEWN